MWISTYHCVRFDSKTEADLANEFEKMHPDWSKHLHSESIAFTDSETHKYRMVPTKELPTYNVELLMPGIYIEEVK